MSSKRIFLAVIALSLICLSPIAVLAQTLVGVKTGQYAEYNVSYTGTPMVGHDATWARMEIAGVEGPAVNVTFISRLTDGTLENVTENLNFAAGRYIDYFVVPAGLQVGDSFYDNLLNENVTITKLEAKTYAGAERTVISGATAETDWWWDQKTGALVEAHSIYPDFTLDTIIDKTDIWSAQPKILELPPLVLFTVVLVILAAVLTVLLVFRRKRKKVSTGLTSQ